ncbi:hypothetical protein BDZ89DRAFT_367536 [Hymenopellis radicata]|nr:hypothetical protein BDZ89DRAFT_367536 [Hymenopellis radicata]
MRMRFFETDQRFPSTRISAPRRCRKSGTVLYGSGWYVARCPDVCTIASDAWCLRASKCSSLPRSFIDVLLVAPVLCVLHSVTPRSIFRLAKRTIFWPSTLLGACPTYLLAP